MDRSTTRCPEPFEVQRRAVSLARGTWGPLGTPPLGEHGFAVRVPRTPTSPAPVPPSAPLWMPFRSSCPDPRHARTAALGSLLLVLLVASCTTGEQRTSFEVEALGLDGGSAVTNDHGWTIALDEAVVALGPLYFFEGDPLFARRTIVDRLLGIRVAHAHPGHYQEGDALAQLLEEVEVDLLASAPVPLGTAEGVTGDYNSAQVGIRPLAGGVLDGGSLVLAGTATREADTVAFTSHVSLEIDVEGIAFDHDVDGSPGRVRVGVDVHRFLLAADFTDLVGSAGPVEVPETSQVFNALNRGVDNTSAYIFEWIEE